MTTRDFSRSEDKKLFSSEKSIYSIVSDYRSKMNDIKLMINT